MIVDQAACAVIEHGGLQWGYFLRVVVRKMVIELAEAGRVIVLADIFVVLGW
jgi:hypothetical protein